MPSSSVSTLGMGFGRALVFRPGVTVPRRGVRHSVDLYGWMAILTRPILLIVGALGLATSAVEIGRAMIAAARGERVGDPPKQRLGSKDINELATRLA